MFTLFAVANCDIGETWRLDQVAGEVVGVGPCAALGPTFADELMGGIVGIPGDAEFAVVDGEQIALGGILETAAPDGVVGVRWEEVFAQAAPQTVEMREFSMAAGEMAIDGSFGAKLNEMTTAGRIDDRHRALV